MVFTDTIKFLTGNKHPVVSLSIDPFYELIAILTDTNNQVKIYDLNEIYKWEWNLRKSISSKQYVNDSEGFNHLSILGSMNSPINYQQIKFSQIQHSFILPSQQPNSKSYFESQSKTSGKKIRINRLDTPVLKKENSSNLSKPSFILAMIGDHGQISFAMNKPTSITPHCWGIVYELILPAKCPSLDFTWGEDDNMIAVASFGLEVYLYQCSFEGSFVVELKHRISTNMSPPRQVLWSPSNSALFSIFTKDSIILYDTETFTEIEREEYSKQQAIMMRSSPYSKKTDISNSNNNIFKGNNIRQSAGSIISDTSDLIDEDIMDFIHSVKLETSWSADGALLGSFIKQTAKKGEDEENYNTMNGGSPSLGKKDSEYTQELTLKQGSLNTFIYFDIETPISIKISPFKYVNSGGSKTKKEMYKVMVYEHENIYIYSIEDSKDKNLCQKKPDLKIFGVNKTFLEFIWMDAYRILGLDEMGRVHMFSFNQEELGIALC